MRETADFRYTKRNEIIRFACTFTLQPSLLTRAVSLFSELFEILPRVYDHRKRKFKYKFYSVEIESKSIFQFIQKYLRWGIGRRCRTISLKHDPERYSRSFLYGFVRGLIESDGRISHGQVGFTSVSPALVKNFQQALELLGYRFSVRCNQDKRQNRASLYHVTIPSSQDFLERIRPIK